MRLASDNFFRMDPLSPHGPGVPGDREELSYHQMKEHPNNNFGEIEDFENITRTSHHDPKLSGK